MAPSTSSMQERKPILVVGGTGKTGRRVAERLAARGVPVRIGSRSANPAFDWDAPSGWAAALDGAGAVYITYYPDLAAPGAPEAVRRRISPTMRATPPHPAPGPAEPPDPWSPTLTMES